MKFWNSKLFGYGPQATYLKLSATAVGCSSLYVKQEKSYCKRLKYYFSDIFFKSSFLIFVDCISTLYVYYYIYSVS